MRQISRRLALSFDWLWFLAMLGLAAIGAVTIWSTTQGTSLDRYLGRQLLYIALALAVYLVLLCIDYHIFADFVMFIYLCGIGMLVVVLVAGQTIHANKSWVDIAGFTFQPSELVKVIVILALAKYYSDSDREQLEIGDLLLGGLIVFVPMALVLMQGDLGTAMTFVPIYAGLSFMGGLKRKHVLVLSIAAALAVPVGWMMLKDYQKGRIQTVLNPANDPQNRGYQAIQSKIAIGSGEFLGKGLKQGSQGQLGFLPARHTDFVFAVWAEEKGFVGTISLLGLLLFLFLRMMKAARESKDKIGTFIIVGVLSLFLFHVTVNIGMNVGLLPIAGIPLPFLSAGGSSLISCFAAMALCMNINMRRYVN